MALKFSRKNVIVEGILQGLTVDLTQERFRYLLHLFLYQVCKQERDYFRKSAGYDHLDDDTKVAKTVL